MNVTPLRSIMCDSHVVGDVVPFREKIVHKLLQSYLSTAFAPRILVYGAQYSILLKTHTVMRSFY